VYTAEVESALHAHPSVAQAAVFGTPHPVMGEIVNAVVTLRPAAREPGGNGDGDGDVNDDARPRDPKGDILAHCRRTLSGYKVPASVKVVHELPTNASGKILKRKLREQCIGGTLVTRTASAPASVGVDGTTTNASSATRRAFTRQFTRAIEPEVFEPEPLIIDRAHDGASSWALILDDDSAEAEDPAFAAEVVDEILASNPDATRTLFLWSPSPSRSLLSMLTAAAAGSVSRDVRVVVSLIDARDEAQVEAASALAWTTSEDAERAVDVAVRVGDGLSDTFSDIMSDTFSDAVASLTPRGVVRVSRASRRDERRLGPSCERPPSPPPPPPPRPTAVDFVAAVRAAVVDAANVPDLANDQPLMQAGLASNGAVAVHAALETAFNVTLPATLVFDYPTVDAIAAHVEAAATANEEEEEHGANATSHSAAAVRAFATTAVHDAVREVLELPRAADVPEDDAPLMQRGLTSSAAVRLRDLLDDALATDRPRDLAPPRAREHLPSTLAFDHPTIGALVAFAISAMAVVREEEDDDAARAAAAARAEMTSSRASASEVRSIQTIFTHRPVSTFDRVSFQLTGELFLYGMALSPSPPPPRR
jgi:acyl carrier protein